MILSAIIRPIARELSEALVEEISTVVRQSFHAAMEEWRQSTINNARERLDEIEAKVRNSEKLSAQDASDIARSINDARSEL